MTAEVLTRPETTLTAESIEQLSGQVRGAVITPSDPRYDEARSVYNAMIDKHPALILQCQDVADVIQGVNFASAHGLPVAVRGGGHNAAGLGTGDDCVVLDLKSMNGVHVDPQQRRVRVEGGATWGEVDHATQAFELAVPAGIVSSTGVGGLTLGGGFGYISRDHGLTIDNLVSADLVLADGSFVTANATDHPDLFWAIRGGGGNFGVVTSFEFQAHPVGMVTAGVLFYQLDQARALMELYREFIRDAPRKLGLFFGYAMAPPAPFVPEELQMKNMAKIVVCYNGPQPEANAAIAPFLAMEPALNLVSEMPLAAMNSLFDALLPPGRQNYWKADFMAELTDEQIAIHLEYGPRVPNPAGAMHLYSVNGAIHDVDPSETAYSYRDATFCCVILTTEDAGTDMSGQIAYSRQYWEALHPHSAGGAYVNFMMDEGADRIHATYRDNYPRLREIKTQYDPRNLFRVNQNIKPLA